MMPTVGEDCGKGVEDRVVVHEVGAGLWWWGCRRMVVTCSTQQAVWQLGAGCPRMEQREKNQSQVFVLSLRNHQQLGQHENTTSRDRQQQHLQLQH